MFLYSLAPAIVYFMSSITDFINLLSFECSIALKFCYPRGHRPPKAHLTFTSLFRAILLRKIFIRRGKMLIEVIWIVFWWNNIILGVIIVVSLRDIRQRWAHYFMAWTEMTLSTFLVLRYQYTMTSVATLKSWWKQSIIYHILQLICIWTD